MDEIIVHVQGHATPQGAPFEVRTQALGAHRPAGTTTDGLLRRPILFYDVSIRGISGGNATVSITNDSVKADRTKMQFWDGMKWVDVETKPITGHTISGDIPVLSLRGTPISIGTN